MSNKISKKLNKHYSATFEKHGANSEGVDWGRNADNLQRRYRNMLAVVNDEGLQKPSILDVGCGYGGLYEYITNNNLDFDYTGVDVSAAMIEWAKNNYKEGADFFDSDILEMQNNKKYDYVVCNGVLTQKLDVSNMEMDLFARNIIKKMFVLANIGIAFNMMTTMVNYFSDNLFYKNPSEMLAWCMNEVSPYIRIDHSYPMYEFTVYIYKAPI